MVGMVDIVLVAISSFRVNTDSKKTMCTKGMDPTIEEQRIELLHCICRWPNPPLASEVVL